MGGRAEGGAERLGMAGPSARARRVPAHDSRCPRLAAQGQSTVYACRHDGDRCRSIRGVLEQQRNTARARAVARMANAAAHARRARTSAVVAMWPARQCSLVTSSDARLRR